MTQAISIKIGMIIIPSSNLEQSIEFYKNLGLQLKFHLKEKWAEFNVNGVKFGLCPTNQPINENHTGIVLEINDLIAFKEELNNKNIALFKDPFTAPHGIMANIKDPSGNIIDLYQPTPEKIKEFAEKII